MSTKGREGGLFPSVKEIQDCGVQVDDVMSALSDSTGYEVKPLAMAVVLPKRRRTKKVGGAPSIHD